MFLFFCPHSSVVESFFLCEQTLTFGKVFSYSYQVISAPITHYQSFKLNFLAFDPRGLLPADAALTATCASKFPGSARNGIQTPNCISKSNQSIPKNNFEEI
jgi:hypothetical protein